MSVIQCYEDKIASGDYHDDATQHHILQQLDDFHTIIHQHKKQQQQGFWQNLWQRNNHQNIKKWFYLYGGVGCGKTMMMDLWATYAKEKEQYRIYRRHFHEFMIDIQKKLFVLNQHKQDSPLDDIATDIAKNYDILCFDEFFINNIADAMIIGKLCQSLLKCGLYIISTSNYAPEKLYEYGLQRERFLPFIDFLNNHACCITPDDYTDYRRLTLNAQDHYLYPLTDHHRYTMQQWCAMLRNNHTIETLTLSIDSRQLVFNNYAHHVLWTDNNELCARYLGAQDYMALTDRCQHIFIDNMTPFQEKDMMVATRFIHFIDLAYDKNCYCYFHGDCDSDDIFTFQQKNMQPAINRCLSRIREMRYHHTMNTINQ